MQLTPAQIEVIKRKALGETDQEAAKGATPVRARIKKPQGKGFVQRWGQEHEPRYLPVCKAGNCLGGIK